MSYYSAAAIFAVLMAVIVGITFAGNEVHSDDKNLPPYRQRIRIGFLNPGYGRRWHIWATWAAFPLILYAIVFLNL